MSLSALLERLIGQVKVGTTNERFLKSASEGRAAEKTPLCSSDVSVAASLSSVEVVVFEQHHVGKEEEKRVCM